MLPGSDNHVDGTFEHEKGRHSCYHLAWEAMSRSPIYEYKLWLKPSGYPKSNWTGIIVPSNSSALTIDAGSQHKSAYDLCDLARNVVYDVTVQSRNRFGWSDESNALLLSGEQQAASSPAHDEPELTSAAASTTVATTTASSSTSTEPTTTSFVTTTPLTVTPVTSAAVTTTAAITTSETENASSSTESTIGETVTFESTTESEIEPATTSTASTSSTASSSHFSGPTSQDEENSYETSAVSTFETTTDPQTPGTANGCTF